MRRLLSSFLLWLLLISGHAFAAGGPIFPYSSVPVTATRVFYNLHSALGTFGLGVQASVGADSIWRLKFAMPGSIPTGTCKLRLLAAATATSNAAKVNAKWAMVAPDENFPSVIAEGTSTATWAAGDDVQLKELKITLDADTPVANEIMLMDLTFETASWTLAVTSTWIAMVIWE